MKRTKNPTPIEDGHYIKACKESLQQRGFGEYVNHPDGRTTFTVDLPIFMFEVTRAIEALVNEKKPGYRLMHPFKKEPQNTK